MLHISLTKLYLKYLYFKRYLDYRIRLCIIKNITLLLYLQSNRFCVNLIFAFYAEYTFQWDCEKNLCNNIPRVKGEPAF